MGYNYSPIKVVLPPAPPEYVVVDPAFEANKHDAILFAALRTRLLADPVFIRGILDHVNGVNRSKADFSLSAYIQGLPK